MAQIKQINPDAIIFIQSRAEMNRDIVAEYHTMMQDGTNFDPASGLEDERGQVIVWDGSHRGEAARRAGQLLAVVVEPGSREQAEWLALSANRKHGLRRSRADKRQAVQQALRHPNGAGLSNREIARHCGVDHKTVGNIRAEMETSGEIPRITERRVTRAGISYKQETGKLNNFVSVDNLAEALQAALPTGGLPAGIEWLVEIKRRSPQGQAYLTGLTGRLPTPHRPRDISTACHILLAQLRRQIHSTYENLCPRCGDAVYYSHDLAHLFCAGCEQTWAYTNELNAELAEQQANDKSAPEDSHQPQTKPVAANGHNSHNYVLAEEAQPRPCPQCGAQRVRGVNGSKRWCIGCGANWPTAETFLADVAAAGSEPLAARRTALAAQFNDLLPRLSQLQIERLKAALSNLEMQPEVGSVK